LHDIYLAPNRLFFVIKIQKRGRCRPRCWALDDEGSEVDHVGTANCRDGQTVVDRQPPLLIPSEAERL
jgi:hypothetical protein